MDSELIGRFIAALRKEKEWTQALLAEQLGVTDKAVSRWETGHGLPDVSLLKPLGEALGVSVNELLSGQRLEPEEQPAKADDIILETMRQANRRVDKAISLTILVFGALLLFWGLLFLGYDTSWVAIYSWLGTIFIAAAVFHMARKKLLQAVLLAAAVLVVAFGLFEARDYNAVTKLSLPPLYNISILSAFPNNDKVIAYRKPFYTAYRYHVDTPQEYYEIKWFQPPVNP